MEKKMKTNEKIMEKIFQNARMKEENSIMSLPEDDEVKTAYLKEKTCCICGKKFIGFGNNPYPVKSTSKGIDSDDRCCDACNFAVVIPARVSI